MATAVATFSPLPWQIEPWGNQDFIMLLTGSAGGGKSRLAAEKIHGYLLKYPKSTGLVVRKTRESMTSGTVLFLERNIIGPDPNVRHAQSKHRFEYANGSILIYGGMKDEQQREQIRSIGQAGSIDIAWMEEANKFTEADFQELLVRIRGKAAPWRQLILTTNPDSSYHWIYKRLITGNEAATFYSGAADNLYNAPEYLATLDKLTGVLRDRLKEGKWVQSEGVIYDAYSEDTHLVDRFDIPNDWERSCSIDFGFENPFVCQWWAKDGDGRLYLYREIYMTHRIVADHAKQIKLLSEGERISYSVADHDAEEREVLNREGIYTFKALKTVADGIQTVMRRFPAAGDGKARIFFLKDSLVEEDPNLRSRNQPMSTAEEITLYSWARQKNSEIVKDAPQKAFDHGMDAMRYQVMHVENKPFILV